MALSFADVSPQFPRLNMGGPTAVLVRATPDSAWLAGGETIEAGQFGLSEIFAIFVNPSTPVTSGTSAYVTATRVDANSWTLQAFESGAADAFFNEANGDDLSAMRVDLLILGV